MLVVIFFNLYSGIRYSLWAALCAGIMKDCFSTMPFGTNVFVYMACAYLSTVIRRYFYERGSDVSKLGMVLAMVTVHSLLMGMCHTMIFDEIRWADVWSSIWLPQVVTTLAVTIYVFEKLQFVAKKLKFG